MQRFAIISASLGIGLVVAGLGVLILAVRVGPGSLVLLPVPFVIYGWMLYAYMHYRQGRQEELLQVITAAAESELPLASALWAYLSDRPHGTLRETWVAFLLLFVLPGYYWMWHRRHTYDSKVEKLAVYLESGASLHDALLAVPGIVPRETLLAVAVGEPTGQLAFCLQTLRSPARNRLTGLWLEIVPRIVYPLFMLVLIGGVLGFWLVYLAPKYQRIFHDFDTPLPDVTEKLLDFGYDAQDYIWILPAVCLLVLVLLACLVFFATLRWYFPGVSRPYRVLMQSRMLQSLAMLLKMGRPAPEALAVLAKTGYFVAPARRRLRTARRHVEQGQSLADSLRRGRILPAAMVPLVKAAERAGNLPWAMAELAEHLAQRTARRVRYW